MRAHRHAEHEWRQGIKAQAFALDPRPAPQAARLPKRQPKPKRQRRFPFPTLEVALLLVSSLYAASALGAI